MPPLAPPAPAPSTDRLAFSIAANMPDRLVSATERPAAWRKLSQSPLDCLVIGGGITGAGVLCSLAGNDLNVALVEGEDFASGTSGRSSKLIHGGFRYLAQLEFKMVRKTALERSKLRAIAPHLTKPRWMVIPLSSPAKLAFYRSAVWTYEALGSLSSQDRASKALRSQAILDREPAIRKDRFSHAVAFREYQTDDARLVLATLRAAAKQGATALNYARVLSIHKRGPHFVVTVRCGQSHQIHEILAKHLVNAAGPWVEELQRMESAKAPPLLHLSKGIHIGLSAKQVPIRDGVVLRGGDGRYLFALRRGPMVYVGTTDTSYGKDPKRCPEILRADVQYLLDAVHRTLDVGPLGLQDVQSAWSGLRPLIADPKSSEPSELSRKDSIKIGELGMVSVAGGKLSGFRDMAAQVCQCLRAQGLNLPGAQALMDQSPLPGGDFSDAGQGILKTIQAHHPSRPELSRLLTLYGAEAARLAQKGRPLHGQSPILDIEVDWAVHVEGTQTLEDLVYRRLRIPWFEAQASCTQTWSILAARMGALLEWSPQRRQQEIDAVVARQRAELGFLNAAQA